jgi:hypothetical protein
VVRAIDHEIATGVWPDMTEHGWERDEWPVIYETVIYEKVMASDIWSCAPRFGSVKNSRCAPT